METVVVVDAIQSRAPGGRVAEGRKGLSGEGSRSALAQMQEQEKTREAQFPRDGDSKAARTAP